VEWSDRVDLVFDVIGGDIQKRSTGLIRAGGTLVSIVGPIEARPADGLTVDFVVEADRAQLSEIVQRVTSDLKGLDDVLTAARQIALLCAKAIGIAPAELVDDHSQ
jgi:NADPH:quinone reductase-like Zn-dependent oxidoreductase